MPPGVRTGAFPTIQDGYPCESGSPAAPILTIGPNRAHFHLNRPLIRCNHLFSSPLNESYIAALMAADS